MSLLINRLLLCNHNIDSGDHGNQKVCSQNGFARCVVLQGVFFQYLHYKQSPPVSKTWRKERNLDSKKGYTHINTYGQFTVFKSTEDSSYDVLGDVNVINDLFSVVTRK